VYVTSPEKDRRACCMSLASLKNNINVITFDSVILFWPRHQGFSHSKRRKQTNVVNLPLLNYLLTITFHSLLCLPYFSSHDADTYITWS
jgi:hypothetical protein